jgi:hypothetical protein
MVLPAGPWVIPSIFAKAQRALRVIGEHTVSACRWGLEFHS